MNSSLNVKPTHQKEDEENQRKEVQVTVWPSNIGQAIYTVLEWQAHLDLWTENAWVANEDYTLKTPWDDDAVPQNAETLKSMNRSS